jgi:hypothetical protein
MTNPTDRDTMHQRALIDAEHEAQGSGRFAVERRKPAIQGAALASPQWCKEMGMVNGPDPLGYCVDDVPGDLTRVGS